jgi:hypothetical protein
VSKGSRRPAHWNIEPVFDRHRTFGFTAGDARAAWRPEQSETGRLQQFGDTNRGSLTVMNRRAPDTMEALQGLLDSLLQFVVAGWDVLLQLFYLLVPWIPLGAWIAFWMFGVNWVQLRDVLKRGGWVGLLLIGLVMVLVWGVVAPPPEGQHVLFGLELSNFVGKTVYVTGLFTIMLLCGSVQLSGCCARCCRFDDEAASVEPQTHGH